MEKISITLDLGKIDKNKIKTRTYTNSNGQEVSIKEYKLDIVPVKEAKLIKDGGSWQMWKTHFVAEPTSKEEKEAGVKSKILGDGIVFKNVEAEQNAELDSEKIPF